MAKSAKTPAMVLQELAVKHGISPPEYQIVSSVTGTHSNRFDYRVCVFDIVAYGTGTSKQIGKHNVAHNALKELAARGIYKPSEDPVQEFNASMQKNCDPEDSPFMNPLSFISDLKDLCCENKISDPIFTEISDVGPPHCREFTYECQVASMKTQATGNTKKKAKHLAAKDMLEKIKDILPELTQMCVSNQKALTDLDEKVMSKIDTINFFSSTITNKSVKIEDYPYTIAKLMVNKEVTYEDILDDLKIPCEESLKSFTAKLDLSYNFFEIQKNPIVISLSLSTDTPFTCLGVGENLDSARQAALDQVFEILNFYVALEVKV